MKIDIVKEFNKKIKKHNTRIEDTIFLLEQLKLQEYSRGQETVDNNNLEIKVKKNTTKIRYIQQKLEKTLKEIDTPICLDILPFLEFC